MNLKKDILENIVDETLHQLETFATSAQIRASFKLELDALEFMSVSPETRFVRQCLAGLQSIEKQPNAAHASSVVNKLFKLSENKNF